MAPLLQRDSSPSFSFVLTVARHHLDAQSQSRLQLLSIMRSKNVFSFLFSEQDRIKTVLSSRDVCVAA